VGPLSFLQANLFIVVRDLRLDDNAGLGLLRCLYGIPGYFGIGFQVKLQLLDGMAWLLGFIFRREISVLGSFLRVSLGAQALSQQVMRIGDLVVIAAGIAGELDRFLQDRNCFLVLAQERQGLAEKQRSIGFFWLEPHRLFQERQSFLWLAVADVY